MSPLKQQKIIDAKAKLDELGAKYTCPDRDGIHIRIHLPNETLDLWPTTSRWMRTGVPAQELDCLWEFISASLKEKQ